MRTPVESCVDMPVVVAIMFGEVPQEHQLGLQAVFITLNSGSVYQSGEYRLFIGWVIGLDVQVEIVVCGNAVFLVP
jgi:hypothetical protein